MKKIPDLLFPYPQIRKIQSDLIEQITEAIKKKKHLVVHAPTGLGKTVAAIAPALKEALEQEKTVFFLTSRHTQHQIAVETLADIKQKHGINIVTSDIIGKKWMCAQPGVENLYSGEFSDYCRKVREDGQCEFYVNFKDSKVTVKAKKALGELMKSSPQHTEQIIEYCKNERLCPYEMAMMLAARSQVVITDYSYIFNPSIRPSTLKRIGKELKDIILIIDEGHNLPDRIRDLATTRLTNLMLRRAITEAKKFNNIPAIEILSKIQDILLTISSDLRTGTESTVERIEFDSRLKSIMDVDEIIETLDTAAEVVRMQKRQSYIGGIVSFLESWQQPDDGFVRIISLNEKKNYPVITLSFRCLDPAIMAGDVIKETHSSIIMSGTLTPTSMYRDLLGFPNNTDEATFASPFDNKNRKNLIVPYTSTKYAARTPEQFRTIAGICADMVNNIPGNSLIFFPSYLIRDEVYKTFAAKSEKTIFKETSGMTKTEKAEMLSNFKSYEKAGAVLLAVNSGSFGEGIDLPGDFLKAVIVVGLPFQAPDLETKALIAYFDDKFSKGWDYGYIFPAFNKVLQAAGRCIRSETDRGVIVFLDERYINPTYKRCFPADWNVETSMDYRSHILDFF